MGSRQSDSWRPPQRQSRTVRAPWQTYRTRRRLRALLYLTLASAALVWLLPHDNSIRLAVRWNVKQLASALRARPSESWAVSPPAFPVDLADDTVVIVKTGYGTRDRASAWFEALGNRTEFRDFLVIGDFASRHEDEHVAYRGAALPIHDMVKRTLKSPVLYAHVSHDRVQKHAQLNDAIRRGDADMALKLTKAFGWELDALKVHPSPETIKQGPFHPAS